MDIYKVISTNIKNKLELMSNEKEYLKEYPNLEPFDYLLKYSSLSRKRLNNILDCKGKITLYELVIISNTLKISPDELLIKK